MLDSFSRIGIIGFKRSGIALCRMLLDYGKQVKVSDTGFEDSFSKILIERLGARGVRFEFEKNSCEFLSDCDLVVVSPGVDVAASGIGEYTCARGIPVYGEMEVASWVNRARIVAITGTNGKTTTTFLAYSVLKSKFPGRVYLAGNIGIPFSEVAPRTKEGDIVVLEVSSFQLETIRDFHPAVSCITNIEPDHLDRYAQVSDYVRAKKNIFSNQTANDFAVLNRNCAFSDELKSSIHSQVRYFSDEFENENYSAVSVIAGIFAMTKEECARVFSEFRGLPHRMQKVREFGGVTFINDSKATNPSSTIWALKNTKGPVRLIAGGKDKGLEYGEIAPYLNQVKKIYLYGQARTAITQALSFYPDIARYDGVEEAVRSAAQDARRGEVVLFSPMCSSFDLFKNYQERGKFFIQVVNNLNAETSTRT
ncbi:MAG: hypothetical protein JXD21_05770 [Candidatus Omnitrophica bacterium]|nr:hypothetical protein [Candidatus Omnitrophota bacterium]